MAYISPEIEVKPWQVEAADFLVDKSRAFVFDAVGLGKTVEALVAAVKKHGTTYPFHVFVVCENSLIRQWVDEIRKFVFCAEVYYVGSKSPAKRKAIYQRFAQSTDMAFMVINYDKLRVDFDILNALPADIIIFDEATILSNLNKTRQFCKWFARKVKQVFVLTATPFSRDIMQLYDLMEAVGVKIGERKEFMLNYCITRRQAINTPRGRSFIDVPIGSQNLDKLKPIIAPVIIRRTKQHIAKYITSPTKNYYYRIFNMSKEQQRLYEQASQGFLELFRKGELFEGKHNPLTTYTYLTQVLASPFLVDNRILDSSPKVDGIASILKEIGDDQTIVYARFVEMGRLIKERLDKEDYKWSKAFHIHGGLSIDERADYIDSFNKGNARVLVVSDVAQRGLNLQVAPNMIFTTIPYTPAAVQQIIGRIDRLGQQSPILNIFFMLMNDSIELNVFKVLKDRQFTFDGAFDESDSEIFNLSGQDLSNLLEHRITEDTI